jgi:hypothetical protein
MAKFGKRRSGPWYGEDRTRLLFEGPAREFFPTLKRQLKRLDGTEGCSYIVDIDVPFYERRRIEVFFSKGGWRDVPTILADGPTDSPHRFPSFDRRSLCVWLRYDPREQRWTFDDGLLQLLGLIKLHLFREAWWRETGEWPGPQAPHAGPDGKQEIAA